MQHKQALTIKTIRLLTRGGTGRKHREREAALLAP